MSNSRERAADRRSQLSYLIQKLVDIDKALGGKKWTGEYIKKYKFYLVPKRLLSQILIKNIIEMDKDSKKTEFERKQDVLYHHVHEIKSKQRQRDDKKEILKGKHDI